MEEKNGTKKRNRISGEPRQKADPKHAGEAEEKGTLPIVGIGASAGGLTAFETFFSSIPADIEPDMAFVIVQHLAPDHKSALSDIIRSYTKMAVFEVTDGLEVMPNSVYIIPPNKAMALLNGKLHLLKPAMPRGQRLPIDFFFRSLAQDQHEKAICIVLSGTGSDGSQGIRAVKGEGGLVIVQAPETTEHDGMLLSAVATGAVDFVLPVNKMPGQLLDYVSHVFGKRRKAESVPAPKEDGALKKIFIILRAQTGNDFSQYKTTTIYRRIERRMAINQIETMENYVRFLQQSDGEVEALYHDLLIGVTQFFRDADAFRALEEMGIPAIFADKPEGSAFRAWVPCCSTGEEAYSIAILISEYLEARSLNHPVQIFATDIDSRAITTARAGVYPAGIASDISPERLKRFFTPEPQGNAYRIAKSVRDMLIFSEQNIVRDPPFSRLDLISCRNFLIYLNRDLQKRLISLFDYSLNPGGLLFLGNSENISEPGVFDTLDHNARIFQTLKGRSGSQKISGQLLFPSIVKLPQAALSDGEKKQIPGKPPLREIAEQALLNREDMAGALVNSRGDIVYLHGRSGLYLEPAPGEAEMNNILKMAREGLKYELTAALHKAAEKKEIVRRSGLRVKTNGHFTPVNISVHPPAPEGTGGAGASYYLVVLERGSQSAPDAQVRQEGGQGDDVRIEALKQQLCAKEEYLQAANEELETANEELSSSNEEMQSINEELQSTNEELETSREELQSVNEELSTVNAELHAKVGELSKLNNDMNNMLSGTGVGTVFVDHQLRIMRFTPAATEIINLISGDVGRPVAHIASNLTGYNSLIEDIEEVLRTLAQKQTQVRTNDGKWYAMRIKPYRTVENMIEGAVITFADITELKLAKEALLKLANDALTESEKKFRAMVETAGEGIVVAKPGGDFIFVNKRMADMLGYPAEEILGKSAMDFCDDDWKEQNLRIHRDLHKGDILSGESKFCRKDGSVLWSGYNASPMFSENGEHIANLEMHTDITKRKEAEEALNESNKRISEVLESIADAFYAVDGNWRLTYVNRRAEQWWGKKKEALIGTVLWDMIPASKKTLGWVKHHEAMEKRVPVQWETYYPGLKTWMDVSAYPVSNGGLSVYLRDITEVKLAKEQLTASELRFRSLFEAAQYGILTLDADTGVITGVNQFLVGLLGYSEKQFKSKKIWDIGFLRDIVANKSKFYELQEEEYIRYDGLPLETADGRRVDVEFISSVYTVNDKKVVQCAIRELKKAEVILR